MLKNNNNPIPSQLHRTNLRPKRKLTDASALVIIPDQYFGRRVPRVRSTANKRQDVAPEKHLYNLKTTVLQVAPERFFERLAVVYAETMACSSSETTGVLVP